MAFLVVWLEVSRWGDVLVYMGWCGAVRPEERELYLHEDDVCAGFSEGDGDGCAYTSGCACNEGGLPFEGEEGCSSHVGCCGLGESCSHQSEVASVVFVWMSQLQFHDVLNFKFPSCVTPRDHMVIQEKSIRISTHDSSSTDNMRLRCRTS